MQRHYAHHRLNGEKHNATTFLSARRDDARRAYAMTVHYYRLRDYALQHPECSAIMRIID
ncbi:antirestriction protein [Escherichia coli]|uniref:antirestriction protein n=1 Tax=Escherichia coli TaxID=562 RepID=UPI0024DEAABC|nr:antirestriction protein [Escherichia coli]